MFNKPKETMDYQFGLIDDNEYVLEISAVGNKGIFNKLFGKMQMAMGTEVSEEELEVNEVIIREDYYSKLNMFMNKQYDIILKDIRKDAPLKHFRFITHNIIVAKMTRKDKNSNWDIFICVKGTYSND